MGTDRLAKHLAHAGVASRRAAEALIAEGRVTVDGETVTDPAQGVTGKEAITFTPHADDYEPLDIDERIYRRVR